MSNLGNNSKFNKEFPYEDLAELVAMLRGQKPAGASLIADRSLWCLGCLNRQYGLPPDIVMMRSAATMDNDVGCADEIDRLVTESRAMAAESSEVGAPKAMPPWVSQLIQMLLQLWLSRKATA